jgi:glyoxylase-like metal-dependent hydrolase (beta-lactamase superfamily II)
MKLQQVSDNCFAVLNERNRVCDANSGLVNRGGGVVIDTQADLPHARRMIDLFGKVWPGMPRHVINTHEDGDHVWGNQLFEGAEIIAHRTVKELMPKVADPRETVHERRAGLPGVPQRGGGRALGSREDF